MWWDTSGPAIGIRLGDGYLPPKLVVDIAGRLPAEVDLRREKYRSGAKRFSVRYPSFNGRKTADEIVESIERLWR